MLSILLLAACNLIKSNQISDDWLLVPDSIEDGETLKLSRDGKEEVIVKLCGIDAPETNQKIGKESLNHLRSLIPINDFVMLKKQGKNQAGEIIAEVFVNDPNVKGTDQKLFVNEAMVKAGMAYHNEKSTKRCKKNEILAEAEEIARSAQLGIWGNVR